MGKITNLDRRQLACLIPWTGFDVQNPGRILIFICSRTTMINKKLTRFIYRSIIESYKTFIGAFMTYWDQSVISYYCCNKLLSVLELIFKLIDGFIKQRQKQQKIQETHHEKTVNRRNHILSVNMNVNQELLEIKLLITQSSAFFGFDPVDNFVAPCLFLSKLNHFWGVSTLCQMALVSCKLLLNCLNIRW